jgi:hypothetical protein
MKKIFYKFSIVLILFVLLLSFSTKTKQINGTWRIETVLIGNDTLFMAEKFQITSNFYNNQMSAWKKTKTDAEHIIKCMMSTYTNLNEVRLNLKRNKYNQSIITPVGITFTTQELKTVIILSSMIR